MINLKLKPFTISLILVVLIIFGLGIYVNRDPFAIFKRDCSVDFLWMEVELEGTGSNTYTHSIVNRLNVIVEQYDFNKYQQHKEGESFISNDAIVSYRNPLSPVIYLIKGQNSSEISVQPLVYFNDEGGGVDCISKELSKMTLTIQDEEGDVLLREKSLDDTKYQIKLEYQNKTEKTYELILSTRRISPGSLRKKLEVHWLPIAEFKDLKEKYEN